MRHGPITLQAVFLAACGLLALLMQPRHYLNDELVQAASLDGLANGHIWLSGNLPHFADLTAPGPWSTVFSHWAIPAPGARGPPIASLMVSFLALPILGLETALAQWVGVRLASTLPAAVLATWGASGILRFFGATKRLHWLALAGVAALFIPVGGLWATNDMAQQPTLEFSSIILVSIVSLGIAAAFLFDLIRKMAGQGVAIVSTVVFLGTPVWFWAETGKYCGASVALVALAMWAFSSGFRGSPLKTGLAFAATGLAIWNQLPLGIFLLGALGLAALASLDRPTLGRHLGAAAAGLAIGLIPDVLTRILLAQAHLPTQFGPAAGSGLVAFVRAQLLPGGLLGHSVFTDPGGVLYAAYRGIVWTSWREDHYALALVATAPWIGCLAGLLLRPANRARLGRPIGMLTLSYILIVFLVMGKEFLNIGGGPDMRYGITFWPMLVACLAPVVADLVHRQGTARTLGAAGFGALAGFLLTLALDLGFHAAQRNVTPQGIYYDQTVVVRCLGPVLAALLAVGSLVQRWSRSPAFALVASGALALGAVGPAIVYLIQSTKGPFVSWLWPHVATGLAWVLFRHVHGFDVA